VRRAGCDCLLLSISPFHNAFLSCEDNERAYRMIVEVFGPQGIFPWHPGHYPFLRRVDPSRPVPFEQYVQHFDRRELEYQLFGINYLHPAGRAAWTLSRTRHQPQWREAAGSGPQQAAAAGPRQTSLLPGRPAEAWLGKRCSADLSSPVHAHVDARGRYLTGFCSGLQIGDRQAFDLRSLFEEGIPLADFPVLEMLVEGGLASLFGSASRQGFLPDPEGYVSACHLCVHLRTWLFCRLPGEQRPKELAPDFFYEEMRRLAGL
jgi:hypothetical protein